MKKSIYFVIMLFLLALGMMCACGKQEQSLEEKTPNLMKIQSICTLATVECYYHDVAIIEKAKDVDPSLINFLKRDRHMWIEYTGIAKIGIDVSKIDVTVEGDNIRILIPQAKLLSVSKEDFTPDSYYASPDDWLVKNKVTAADQTKAVNATQEEMKKQIIENDALLQNAQVKAQKLIANYIEMLGHATGVKYNITWEYEDGSTSIDIPEEEEVLPNQE